MNKTKKKSKFRAFFKGLFTTNLDLKMGAIAIAFIFWLLIGYFAII